MNSTSIKRKLANPLPQRVVRAIRNQQAAGERMVGWFQLSFVTLFGLLYLVSPKTFSPDKTFALVPWVLMIYLGLTIIRILIAYRSRMSAPLLYLSVVIDMELFSVFIAAGSSSRKYYFKSSCPFFSSDYFLLKPKNKG